MLALSAIPCIASWHAVRAGTASVAFCLCPFQVTICALLSTLILDSALERKWIEKLLVRRQVPACDGLPLGMPTGGFLHDSGSAIAIQSLEFMQYLPLMIQRKKQGRAPHCR